MFNKKQAMKMVADYTGCNISDLTPGGKGKYDSFMFGVEGRDYVYYVAIPEMRIDEALYDSIDRCKYEDWFINSTMPYYTHYIDQQAFREKCMNYYLDAVTSMNEEAFMQDCVTLGIADWEDFDEGGKYEDPDDWEDWLSFDYASLKVQNVEEDYGGCFADWYVDAKGLSYRDLIDQKLIDWDTEKLADLYAFNLESFYPIYKTDAFLYYDNYDAYLFEVML